MPRKKRLRSGLAMLLSVMMIIPLFADPLAAGAATGGEGETDAGGIAAASLSVSSTTYKQSNLGLLGDEFKLVLDNFDAADVSKYSRNPSASGTVAFPDSPLGAEYGKALQFNYDLAQGYNGVILRRDIGGALPQSGAWPGLAAIELTVQADTPIPNPILQLNIGDAWPGSSYEADLKKHVGFDANSTAPQHLVIPIAEFVAKGGTAPIPSTDNVISFAMYMGGSGQGSVTLDEAKLIFAKALAVDSFDGYADDAALAAAWAPNTNGGTNARTLTAQGAGKAMTFAYDAASFNSKGYTGAVKSLAGQDWTGTGAVALDFTGDGLGQDILLQLTSGASASMEAHLANVPGFDPASTAKQHLVIPLAMFAPKSGGMTLAPDQMKGIALYVNKTGAGIASSSSLTLDNIVRLVPSGSEQAGGGEVKFNETNLAAQGSDNLLSVLNAAATVSDGGRIVGVKYESSKPEILANVNGGYVYKGLFRQSGAVRVKLQSVQAEINGAVKEIAVTGELSIEVSSLAPSVDVLDYLKGLRGQGVLTAMHNKEPNTNPRETTDRLLAATGETPAIWSGDFLYQARDVNARQTMIDEAIRQWNDGSLVNIMLHVAPPNRTVAQEKEGAKWDDRTATADQNGVQAYLSEAQWDSLLTDGGELNENWKKRLDEYYRYLIQLKQAGVTAMFRPFHEMNQHVFWWVGNPEHTKALYRLTHDYLVDVKGLDNLIWVWDVQDLPANYGDSYGYNAADWSSFNPGENYWDVFALDVYDAKGYTQANYDQAVSIAGDKPMAIGECWVLPTQQELAAQPNWVFAMPWAGDTFDYNSAEKIKTFYQSNLTLADTPAFQTRRVGTVAIDDFEGYADNAALTAAYTRDASGGTNSVALQASPLGGSGKQALAMTYNTNRPDGYTGTSRALHLDITGAKTIKLWFQGNGNSGQTVLIRLASGAPDRWFEFDLLDLRGFSATAKTPQYLEIPIEAFKPLAAGTTFDPSRLLGLGFYVKKLGGENRSGTLTIDGVSYSKLAPAKEAPGFKIDFGSTAWQAAGGDTLMKLLKANTTITALGAGTTGAAPYLFQVLYDSNDDEILRNEGLFSSKGIFRKTGTVEVTIKQVTVYAGNKQHYIEVNRKVTIDVGALAEPVNVLEYLKALTGNGTLSAMHNKEPNERPRITTDRIMETTGVTPAIWSGDFLFLKDDVANRQKMIDEAIRQWNDGALINIMFHVPSATRTVEEEKQGADWSGSANAVQTDLTPEQWTSLLTDGGDLNKNWKLRLDEYAKYLQQLEDAGVVPMVRPFHEMNQHAFWWAGVPQNTAALSRLTKDYLVNVKGLDNMIWMWNMQDFDNRMNWQDYNPGSDYWDILTLDAYTNGLGSKGDDYYAQMKRFAAEAGGADGPKPMGIGESFKLLDTAGLAKYKDYAMMMPWADDAWVYNTDDALRTFYKNTVSILDTPVFASTLKGGSGVETKTYNYDLVTEVYDWGQNVKGLVIDMGVGPKVNASDISKSAFEVGVRNTTGTGAVAYEGLRTITNAYVNDTGKIDGAGASAGRYVVLEFKTGKDLAEAATTSWDGAARQTTLLSLGYSVKQESAIGALLPLAAKYVQGKQTNLIVDDFEHGTYADANGEHAYNLFVPKNKQAGQKYPLVLWLHGNGERGGEGLLPMLSSKGATAFADPSAQAAYGGMYVLAPQFSAAHGAPDDIVDGVSALVKKLLADDSRIDPSRVYIVGASAGGTRTWKLLLQEPKLYAAAIAIASTTAVPGNLNLTTADYEKLKDVPIWLFHSANDTTINVSNSRAASEALTALGGNVRYTEYTGVVQDGVTYDGHQSWVPVLDNGIDAKYDAKPFDWLFAQSLAGGGTVDPDKYKVALDDFSTYSDSAQLSGVYGRNTNGGQNTLTLVPSPFGEGLGNAMKFEYDLTNGYSGRSRTVNGYWPGLEAVELWVQTDGKGQDILLQLSDGASYEAHLNNVAGFDKTSTAPQHLVIPIGEFKRKEGTGTLNTKGVASFALYVNKVGAVTGGTVTLDEIQLVFGEKPVLPEISFAKTELQADGIGNLISLLNASATLPAGAKIVQATYVSSDAAVLPNFDRFAPKGDFLKEGHTNVTLKQVKLYQDGTTFTIDVNAQLSVTVSHLPAAVDVVEYLKELTGHGILSAMHHDQSYSNPAANDVLHQRVANEFGVYPALYSADFLTGGTVPYRQNMIDEIKRQWAGGSLVQIMFHVSPPQYTVAQEAEGGWGGDTAQETLPSPNRIYSFLYNDQWKELLTDGTALNKNWKLRMDEYAKFLQQLEDAGVTVMLRPFHEMNQHVFWWGGRPGPEGSAALYRMFHDYMEKDKGLSNIIWVWNVQDLPDDYGYADGDAKFDRYEGLDGGLAEYDANDWNSFNPGKDYYDILSVDFYDAEGYATRHYEQAKRIAQADGKPMIVGETFVFPTQAEQAAQPDWTLAMPWGIRTWNYNTKEAMAAFYQNSIGIDGLPRFATRDNTEVPPVDPGTGNPGTVTPTAGNSGTAVVSDGAIAVKAAPDAQGNVAITLNSNDVKKAAAGARNGRLQIAIDTGGTSIKGTATVNVPLQEWLGSASAGGVGEIAVTANGATIVVRTDAGLIGTSAKQLTLTIAKADGATLSAAAKSKIGDRPVYDLGLTVDGAKPADFGTGGAVSVSLDYKPQAGELAHKLVVYYIAEDGALQPIKKTSVDAPAGKISFEPRHFSRYAVGYADVTFGDLSQAAWAREAIETLAARQIANGTGDGKFEPARPVTRAEFLKLLLEALELSDPQATASFSDMTSDAWYYGAVATGAKLGIVKGRADGTFGASDTITREDMAAMLARAIALTGELDASEAGDGFKDQASIADYAREAVGQLANAGLINGFEDGTFSPKGETTRAQAANVIYKLLNF
ncbi:glycosyl hydrolase [Cohnella sp. GCM10020058]|uniref:glycosyl hydrolase n=1 Tax=Cohnella sp. GCM10020058 TaxID=3317330 RepID=UPI00363D632D